MDPRRIQMNLEFCFHFILFSVSCLCCLSEDHVAICEHYVSIFRPVLLSCENTTDVQRRWKYENEILYTNQAEVDKRFSRSVGLLTNYSLYIHHVMLVHEGIFECAIGSVSARTHLLFVQVPPNIFLSYDGAALANKTYGRDGEYNETFRGKETYIEAGNYIDVTCVAEGAKPHANLTWMKNDNMVHDVPYNFSTNRKENRTFDSKSILGFTAAEENITVTCNSNLNGTNIAVSASATFFTYVKPSVYFLPNDSRVLIQGKEVYVPENETVNIVCYAEGSRPAADLTCDGEVGNVESFPNKANRATYDTKLTLTITPKNNSETVICRSTLSAINEQQTVYLKLTTYVAREPSITWNGESYDTIYITANDSVTLICSAAGSRPEPNISWRINGESNQDRIFQDSSSPNFIYKPKHNDIVECISYMPGPNLTWVVDVTFNVTAQTEKTNLQSSDNNKWLIPCAVATFVILILYCIYTATRKYNASKSTDLSLSPHLALSQRPVNGRNNMSRELPAIRQSMHISPEDETLEINCDKEQSSSVTNVEIVVQLPGEGMFQYWTAIASFENDSSKKIIAKCVSESAQLKDHLKFRTLADAVWSLKKHRNIVEILGVSTANVPYYIYMEYLEYGTLRDFLLRNYQQSSDSQSNITQALDERAIHLSGFALDVADGLMYLTDRDFRHPALCTRKVLLNKSGICKLYDFCPKELATEKMNQILQKTLPPLAWLSPEIIFLRHYTDKSDVWTFGIVVWEIYSLGESPYNGLTCEEIEQEIRKMRYLDQPLTCPGGIFSMMLASWTTAVDERPDLSEWKQKLVCLLQSAKQNSDEKNGTGGTGDKSYFTLENNVCDYEDDYIEQ